MKGALGTLFFLTMEKDGSAKVFNSGWRVNSVDGASHGGGSREVKCKGCPPAQCLGTLLQRGGATVWEASNSPPPLFSFLFLLLFPVHRWECLHSTRITNAASAFKVQYGSVVKLAWAHADAALLWRKATANARGAQAAALRQRRIKLRQSEMKAELKSFRLLTRNYFPRSYFSDRLAEVFITWHVK